MGLFFYFFCSFGPCDGRHSISVAMAVAGPNSNPFVVCKHRRRSREAALCVRCFQEQQVAMILRFFHTRQPSLSAVPPPVTPAAFHLCSLDLKVIVMLFKLQPDRHPVKVQSRCWRFTVGLRRCLFSRHYLGIRGMQRCRFFQTDTIPIFGFVYLPVQSSDSDTSTTHTQKMQLGDGFKKNVLLVITNEDK